MILKVMGFVNFACSKVILKSMIILNGERLEGGTKDGEIGEKQIFDLAQRLQFKFQNQMGGNLGMSHLIVMTPKKMHLVI